MNSSLTYIDQVGLEALAHVVDERLLAVAVVQQDEVLQADDVALVQAALHCWQFYTVAVRRRRVCENKDMKLNMRPMNA